MKSNSKTQRPNSRSALLKSGCIGAFYTLNGYFLKVKPAYKIDKVIFSFVQKGKSGEGFDIYVDIDKFDLLCDSILSKDFGKLLPESNQEHPAWKYVTGNNGSKSLTIFKGNHGIVIHGYDGQKKRNASVPVYYTDLQITAKWHRRIFSKYSEKLILFCMQAMEDKSKYFNTQSENPEPVEDSRKTPADDHHVNSTEQHKKASAQAANIQGSSTTGANSRNAGNGKPAKGANEIFIKIKTSTTIQEYGNHKNLCFMGYTQRNKELVFIVTPDNISHFDQANWKAFYNAAKKSTDIIVNIGYVPYKDKLLVTSIAA